MIIRLNSKSTNHNITLRQVRSNISLRHTGIKGDPGEGVPTGGTAGQVLTKDSSTDFDTSWQDPSAAGDVVGPASSTDNAITRFDGTTGKLIQNSDVIIDDDSNMTLPKDSTYSTGYVEKGVIYPAGVDIHWNYTQTATPVLNDQLSPPIGDPVDTSQSMVGAGYRVIWDSTLQDNMPFIGSLSSSGFFGPQGVFHLQGILRYTHNQSNYGMGPIGFADQLIMQNQSGSSITMAAGWQYIGNRQYVADNGTVTFQPSDTFEGTSAFVDNTLYRVANGGTFDGQTNNVWHVGFASIPYLLSDTSMHRVTGFMASEINGGNLSDIGDVNEWVGFHARQYSASGKNIGLLNESGTVNKYLVKTVPNASTQLPTNATFVELNNTSGGPLTLTSTPTISNNPMDGQTITFLNSSANSITLQSNAVLPGSKLSKSITLTQGDQVTYNWSATLDSWQMYTAAGAYMKLTDSAADVAYDDTVGTLYGVTGDDTQEYTDNLTVAMGTLFGQIIGADLPAKISYTETSTASMDFVIDEDNMASNSATKVPTQQSTKAYVDTQIGALPEFAEGAGIALTDLGGGITEISVDEAGVDHGSLAGLSDDDHTQYALLAGRSGGQTLRGGTSKTNNLVLSANSQAYDNKSFGYIETTHPIVWDDNINIGATFTGFFSEGYHRFISQTGTFTLDPTMNAGEVSALKSAVTIKYSSSQIITASPTFMSQNTIQPTAAVNDNALASWSSYIANDRFMPLLTTAITATTTNFIGLQSAPTVGIAAGSHASASGVATNLTAVEAASKVTSQGTATNARGVLVHNPVKEGSGVVTNNIGVDIESMTSGSTLNVGLRIAPSTSTGAQAIQITGTPTTAAGGITFGTDTNLYRSAANTLKTDDNLIVAAAGTAANSVATIDATQTLTNKRVTPRVSTTASSATPTINTDNVDMYGLTAQTADITSFTTNLSGTPTNGQKLWIYIVGTAARAITWGASFENGAVTLPTTTVTTERLDVGFVWNAATSKWRAMASGSAA